MIQGHKPAGYARSFTPDSRKVEQESRQCVHCQFVWIYAPGSGDLRGWCMRHYGFLCGRPECFSQQQTLQRQYEELTTKTAPACVSFEEINELLLDKLHRQLGKPIREIDDEMHRTESGLYLPR